ncbi:hypothetical protein [Streptomyces doebereineriae]|uniref:FTP domain-containing protein n=1 Tax=Streptomyces doebereineriae TaxID=3075528 RepID=A0ABU2VAR4_9ACTN|nr:hypothetical protein [Streptomyces sp. DSM 41640]MDT0482022.1 hypothetical protein [Streptomyces sp. DSM 41640]
MSFEITPNVHEQRDRGGRLRHLEHVQEPYRASTAVELSPGVAANEYLREVAPLYEVPSEWIAGLGSTDGQVGAPGEVRLSWEHESSVMETSVVSYQQSYEGLPIWEAGLSITAHDSPARVTSSTSSLHYDIKIGRPQPPAGTTEGYGKELSEGELLTVLGISRQPSGPDGVGTERTERNIRINGRRQLVFQYDPTQRLHPETSEEARRGPLQAAPPTLPLPPVPEQIRPDEHYLVTEYLFTYPMPELGEVHWRAFVEPSTRSVLYLRAFAACATASVYTTDPITRTGNAALSATAAPGPLTTTNPGELNYWRASVTLPHLPSTSPQGLVGSRVSVVDFQTPTAPPPTSPAPGSFDYSVPSDDFAAACAYNNIESLFQLMEGMGFNLAAYLDGTTFPVEIDHRSETDVNAHSLGNATGTGMGRYTCGLVQSGSTVSMSCDARVMVHEFVHGLLYDTVHSPNLGFVHNSGDSLAVILHAPDSLAPDRFVTFPWVPLVTRRQDRQVSEGWAWGGIHDDGFYESEEILSTTMFRIYRSTGGDSGYPDTRRFAARYLAYLQLRAIGSLATSPITPTPDAGVFATTLMNADHGTAIFEGHPGGAFHKVVRWSFEKQGFYQPPSGPTPVTTPGAPPAVDVYIDDGRAGEYAPYLENFWETTDIWNRVTADGGTTHETPILNVPNYVYCRVKNRGTQKAQDVVVKGYHSRPTAGLIWPSDWQSMTTPSLSVPGGLASGGTTVVGPFAWTPAVEGHECLLMTVSADGDLPNTETVNGPIPPARLVPFDNNVAQRNVAPIPGGGGVEGLVGAFAGRRFQVNNPYSRTVSVKLEATLPKPLAIRNWRMKFANPGGAAFELGPLASREVRPRLIPGGGFHANEVAGTTISIRSLVDGMVSGGMSYAIEAELHELPDEQPGHSTERDQSPEAAARLLGCLDLPNDDVQGVHVRRVTVDIELGPEQ